MDFYKSHIEIYDHSIQNLKKTMSSEQLFQWYDNFFGYSPDSLKMYIAMLNGSCSYGFPLTHSDGKKEFICMLGAGWPDRKDAPTYPKNWYIPIIVHEYCHSYINPLFPARLEEFRELGEELLETHRQKMIEKGYNVWNVILQEYLVRTCTIYYILDHEGKRAAKKRIQQHEEAGFPAINGLVALFDSYLNNREVYPDIESFLPQVKDYFELYMIEINSHK